MDMLRKRFRLPGLDPVIAVTVLLVSAAVVALVLAISSGPALGASGGLGNEPQKVRTKPKKAKLVKGRAIPPSNAPKRVVRAIKAGNRIRKKPYKYGGGHASFKDNGYDCSGAVSYVLKAARMLKAPMTSGGLMRWGRKGKGRWITVYAHGGHTYAVIAGLRWDTSMTQGDGPGWSKQQRSPRGFAVRRYKNF